MVFVVIEPYTMCSMEECNERIRTGEVSIFEMSLSTSTSTPTISSGYDSGNDKRQKQQNFHHQQKQKQATTYYLDPIKAVTKYRRSAAGFDRTTTRHKPRSYQQLLTTIYYLNDLLFVSIPKECFNNDHNNDNNNNTNNKTNRNNNNNNAKKWIQLVQFVEDRIRAIQVDLIVASGGGDNDDDGGWNNSNTNATTINRTVTKQTNTFDDKSIDTNNNEDTSWSCTSLLIKKIQYQITICHIMILYFMSECIEYQSKFGYDALSTSLVNYWNCNCYCCCDCSMMDDEMMSLFLLVQLNHSLVALVNHNSSTSSSSSLDEIPIVQSLLLSQFYRNVQKTQNQKNQQQKEHCQRGSNKFQWTLELVSHCAAGRWYIVLKMLYEGPNDNNNLPIGKHSSSPSVFLSSSDKDNDTTTSTTTTQRRQKEDFRFAILARCCIVPSSLQYIRFQILKQYNHIYQKNHKVSCIEIARILYMFTQEQHEGQDEVQTMSQGIQQHLITNSDRTRTIRSVWDDDDDNNSNGADNDNKITILRKDHTNDSIKSTVPHLWGHRALLFGKTCGLPVFQVTSTNNNEDEVKTKIDGTNGNNGNNNNISNDNKIHHHNPHDSFCSCSCYLQFKTVQTISFPMEVPVQTGASDCKSTSVNHPMFYHERDDLFVLFHHHHHRYHHQRHEHKSINDSNFNNNNNDNNNSKYQRKTTDGIVLPSSNWFVRNVFF